MKRKFCFEANIYLATAYQLAVAFVLMFLSRFVFVAVNAGEVAVHSLGECLGLALRGVRFDLTVLAYFNALFVLMRVLPFGFLRGRSWVRAGNWVYVVSNSLMLALNFTDTVYYRFSGGRLRWSGLQEVLAESNVARIFAGYAVRYWWCVLLFAVFVGVMVFAVGRVRVKESSDSGPGPKALMVRLGMFVLFGGCVFLCMRGRVGSGNPLNIADATWGVKESPQMNVVLNTPFTLLRSIGKDAGVEKLTFFEEGELARMRSSEHKGEKGAFKHLNVMIIITESGGSCFVDTLSTFSSNREELSGLMPFTDSLACEGAEVEHFMATGRRSNEGVCGLLAGFPAFEPFAFMQSAYAAKPFDSMAGLLKEKGYSSAFYYGCNHGSFNIDQLAHAAGFDKVVDRAGYPEPKRDYDGSWGIFDGPMGRYAAADLSTLKQPWIASWFTISAHSPHKVPANEDLSGYKFKEPSAQRGLEYTDRSLREFFEDAKRQPWFGNTVFVITGDHGNRDMAGTVFDTPYMRYHVPLIIYSPTGYVAKRRVTDRAGSQFDLMPTLLGLLGYEGEYVAVGTDLLNEDAESYGISFIDNRFMITSPEYVVFTDMKCTGIKEAYDVKADPGLKDPLAETPEEASGMLAWAQAFLQDYTHRLTEGRLTSDRR